MNKATLTVGSLELTECSVYACNEQADIPCLTSVNPASVVHVTLSESVPTATVKVQLGEKGTVITGTVRDANTGENLNAVFRILSDEISQILEVQCHQVRTSVFLSRPQQTTVLKFPRQATKVGHYATDQPLA